MLDPPQPVTMGIFKRMNFLWTIIKLVSSIFGKLFQLNQAAWHNSFGSCGTTETDHGLFECCKDNTWET